MLNRTIRMCAVLCALALVFAVGAAAQKKEDAKVAGKWEMTWEGPQGMISTTLVLEQDGGKLKGTMTGPRGGETAVSGKVKGQDVELTVKRETPRGEFTMVYKGKLDGETLKGTAEMGPRTLNWTARRLEE
jgi:hypothetical protein